MPPIERMMRVAHGAVRARRALRGPMRPTWSSETETLATFLHVYARQSIRLPIRWQRRAAETALLRTDAVARVACERVDACGVPAEWLYAPGCDRSRTLLYLHGGGYVIGSPESHRDFLSRLAEAAGIAVLAPDYRLAPEYRYPAQLDDALAVYRWLLDRGVSPESIAVAGESAGGNLAAALLIALRDGAGPLPAAWALLSPWVDLAGRSASIRDHARYDYLSRATLEFAARAFCPADMSREDPRVSPVHADLTGLPPLLVHVGGAECLLDEGLRFARRARDAGVSVDLDVWPDMIHAWHLYSLLPEAHAATARVGAFAAHHTR
ncbi:MAG: alpha/beta hydrolase [Deltaproteobacteria bacterium]|nr:MAG: alpha/beta hydrolase [Deltaproteobacteria bacterium]